MSKQYGHGFSAGVMPDGLFGRMLAIVLACVTIPHAVALAIAPEELDRVFEPFYRARAAMTRGVEGTGLGLSIARDIVLGHGGQPTLRNREASGLEAEVVLPRVARNDRRTFP